MNEEKLKNGNTGLIFGGSFILSLIISFVLVMFLGPERDAMFGATAGLMVGLFCFVMSVGAYVTEQNEEAKQIAEHIEKVHVDVGNTA